MNEYRSKCGFFFDSRRGGNKNKIKIKATRARLDSPKQAETGMWMWKEERDVGLDE